LRKAQDTDGYVSVAVGSKTLVGGGRLPVESVAAFAWNRRQLCHGISGNFRVESVAALLWNQWQLWRGIRMRETKRGPKTPKGRRRYTGAWREPKVLIIYVVDAAGKRDGEFCACD
jgi:hypothetical protein